MRWQPNADNAWPDIAEEIELSTVKHGVQHLGPEWWAAIITEELGEFAEAILDLRNANPGNTEDRYEHMREELVQVACTAIKALADLDGHTVALTPTHKHLPVIPSDHYDAERWWVARRWMAADFAATRVEL